MECKDQCDDRSDSCDGVSDWIIRT